MGVLAVSERCCSQNISECLVCDHLQCVTHVMPGGRRGPSHPARLLGVERDINEDLTTPNIELTENMTVVISLLHIAEGLQHIPQQAGKSRAVQPVGGQLTIRTNATVRVIIHLLKQGRNELIFHPSNRGNNKSILELN
jgi:hypothetical protein